MLEKLSIIQDRDLELDNLEKEKKQAPVELTNARAEQEDLEARLADLQETFDNISKQIGQNQLEIGSIEQRRKEAEEAAHRSSSSKEASQYQNQAHQFKTRVEELEEDTLPLMERQEELGLEIKELKDELDALAPKVQELIASEEARIAALSDKIKVFLAERNNLTKDIDKHLLKQYEQIRRSKRGTGLVKIIGGQSCGGCSMRLPIHVVQKVIKSGRGITRCPSCGRILWATVEEDG